jgi:hypothetical protein
MIRRLIASGLIAALAAPAALAEDYDPIAWAQARAEAAELVARAPVLTEALEEADYRARAGYPTDCEPPICTPAGVRPLPLGIEIGGQVRPLIEAVQMLLRAEARRAAAVAAPTP